MSFCYVALRQLFHKDFLLASEIKTYIIDAHTCTEIHLHVHACMCSGVHSLAHLT